MLLRLDLRSAAATRSEAELADGVRSLMLRWEWFACAVLSIVERLLVSEGTSSTDMRTSLPCSPVVQELVVRVSAIEEAAVPTREASNDVWRRLKSGEENVEVW